jgi:hypothetical protein
VRIKALPNLDESGLFFILSKNGIAFAVAEIRWPLLTRSKND